MKSHASMNRIYRLVWSQTLGVMVAVAETAQGKGKASSTLKASVSAVLMSLAALASVPAQAESAPGQYLTSDIVNPVSTTISGTDIGIGTNYGSNSNGSITNSGTISGGQTGIYLDFNTWTGSITNNSGGTISGLGSTSFGSSGIYFYNSSLNGNIVNNGTINGGSGIGGGGQINGGITNSGTIEGVINYGIDMNGSFIANNGAITGGKGGIQLTLGSTGSVTNSAGGRITGGLYGISMLTSFSSGYKETSIINSGTISGGTYAIYVPNSSRALVSITNSSGGLIDGGLHINSATPVTNAGTITLPAGTVSTIAGNYTQTSSGIADKGLSIGVASNTSYGKLVVTGTADFSASNKLDVNVVGAPTLTDGVVLSNVVSSTGLLTAGALVVTDNSALFDFTAAKNANAIDVTIGAAAATGGPSVVSSTKSTRGTSAAGAAVVWDALIAAAPGGDMGTVITALGGLPTEAAVSAAVNQTLPIMSAGMTQVATSNLSGVNSAVQAHMEESRGLSSGDGFVYNRKAWAKPLGSWADQKDSNGTSGYKAQTYGIAVGADRDFSLISRVGAAFAYTQSTVDSNSGSQTALINSYQAVLYGSRGLGARTEINWQAGYGFNQNQGNRSIAFVGRNAASDYSSASLHFGAGIGRTLPISAKTSFIPSFRADYTSIKNNGYTETGAGALNLVVNGKTTDEFILAVDGELSHAFSGTATLTAHLGVGYDTQAKQASITSSFQGGGAAFTTPGMQPSATVVRAGLGYVLKTGKAMEVTARYDVESRTDFIGQNASLKFRMPF
jgi:autotransporter family porin